MLGVNLTLPGRGAGLLPLPPPAASAAADAPAWLSPSRLPPLARCRRSHLTNSMRAVLAGDPALKVSVSPAASGPLVNVNVLACPFPGRPTAAYKACLQARSKKVNALAALLPAAVTVNNKDLTGPTTVRLSLPCPGCPAPLRPAQRRPAWPWLWLWMLPQLLGLQGWEEKTVEAFKFHDEE